MNAGRWLWLCVVATLALVLVLVPGASQAGPPIDPKQMSGIPRADPQVPAGTITVRVLDGSFDKPALEQDVKLQVASADGRTTETFATKTGNQGRATFAGLEAFAGGSAVASTELSGQTLTSQPIEIRGDIGSRVMLVAGAGADAGAGAGAGIDSMSGMAIELDDRPAGLLVVGVLDLAEQRPVTGIAVTLHIEPPEGEPVTREGTEDAQGRIRFEGLLPPDVPEDSKLYVEAVVEPGEAPARSETFEMSKKAAMAVIFTRGRAPAVPPPPSPPSAAPPLPGPRNVTSLPQGTVRVKVVDGSSRPVPDQEVLVIKKVAAGKDVHFSGETDATGVALVEADVDSEAFYMVGVTYDGGPYQSGFFQLDKRGGMAVDVRVYETTSDARVVKSLLQFEVQPSENDMARVYRVWEVMVTGDKAYWPGPDVHIDAQPGAKGLTVLGPAKPWLDHEEKADWVELARPLPPGTRINLSLGYLLEHDGVVDVEFPSPFAVLQASVILPQDLTLHATGARPSEDPHPNDEVVSYELGERPLGTPVQFSVSGLPIRNPMYRRIAIVLGVAMAFAVAVAIARRRGSTREQLLARRDRLSKLLAEAKDDGVRRSRIIAALDRVYRQLDVLEGPAGDARQE